MPTEKEYLAKKALLEQKQDKLIAGSGIYIDENTNTISATGGSGNVDDVKVNGVSVVDLEKVAQINLTPYATTSAMNTALAAKQDTLVPGTNINIDPNTNVISASTGASSLDDLTNVDITTPADGDALVYDATNQKWVNGAGGGGTTVVPNPVGEPAAILNTIGINNIIYDIPGSGSGGGTATIRDTLWTGLISSVGATGTLTKSFSNYDYLLIYGVVTINNSNPEHHIAIVDAQRLKDELDTNNIAYFSYEYYDTQYIRCKFTTETAFDCTEKYGDYSFDTIVGIKLGGGDAVDDILYTDTTGTTGIQTITLNQRLDSYEAIYFEFYFPAETTYVEANPSPLQMLIETPAGATNKYLLQSYPSYGNRYILLTSADGGKTATLTTSAWGEGTYPSIYRIHGVRFGGTGGGADVEANPQDTPTDTLNTIRIGETVYDIAGSGSGGLGGGCKIDTLYQAASSSGASLNTPITYDNGKHLSDYDLCYVYLTVTASGDATLFESHSFCPKDQPRPVFRVTGYGNRFTNVEMTDTNFTVTAETGESWDYTYKVYTILGIKFGSNQSSSDSSEIIPIEAGNNTTTRTFTFAKQPQFIKFYWGDPVISGGWATDAELVWGQTYINYRSKPMGVTTSQVDGGIASIAYGADNKSFTITGANAFGAMNTSNGSGYMFVDYGGSIVTTAYEDIAEGEWTSLLVHTPVSGGSWSAATAIPTDATHIAMMVNYRSTNYEPMILRLADLDKMAEATGNSNVKGGYQWQVGSDYDKVAYDYDSVNKTISVYAGYNGLSVNVFSIKADTPSQDRNAESRTDTIWSGSETTSAWVSPIILDDLPLDDYDMLSVQINDTQQLVMVNQIPTGDSDGNINIGLGGFLRNNDATATLQIFLNRVGNTLRMFTGTGNSANLTKIAGIKFANAKANPMCYAEVEREVGTWTDGKPLYQRTFDLSNTTFSDNAWTNNILGTSGINIKKFEGYFGLVGYDSRFPLDYYRSSGEYFTSMTNNDSTDLSFRPNINAGVGVRGDIITIWYTKNSDVAGSGMYTSTGTPTVHYSTVEHVVGTWIDGKTLYERTMVLKENGVLNYTYSNNEFVDCLPHNIGYIDVVKLYSSRENTAYIDIGLTGGEVIVVPNPTTHNLYFTSQHNPTDVIVTIQYTKSTT